ncbi:hypothetical protein A3F27_02170 [Candidatus Kaiserbacteria bacterium RIFCSPHIGHO2_12_FULL_53_13]|uniref:Major facilitator superfamily (MFS) profile domain-containing protein n=1 Tax=Candidatus Kaiserbacteria bacterium RIFCSPHIGHO2_12_FULL_53_13 TaxID=1798502 RepID=A0A1F6EBU3_9BACT|nr:MAG: hypothetical protein A3F27_02170 [Candidatus Kaiserbacteria bacterium RIFCSPHIGHO2_12_FULL_53_13]OGG74707.1 MAG: hypothetical protein A3A37_02480 [Candidatus Kaiserbacteria bacterium RIFCSPLOWO2_01_FULL_52_36]
MELKTAEKPGGMRNVILISLAFFFIFFGFGTAQQYLVILFNQQGRGHLALASLFLLYGAFLIAGIFISKLVPLLGGLKRSLMIGASTYALFVASVAFNNMPLLLIASVVIGIGAGLLWVCSGQIIADSSNERTAGRNLAFQIISQNGGNIAGIYTGAYLVRAFSLENMYLLLTASVLLGYIFLPWIRPAKEEVKEHVFKPYYAFDRRMLVLFPLLFSAYFLAAQTFTAMNVIIVTLLGVASVPLVISVLKVSNIIGSFSVGTISGWFSKAGTLSMLVLISLSGVYLFTQTYTLLPLIVGAILLGFSMSAIYPVCLSWLKERLPSEEYLYALGTFHVYTNIGVVSAITANLWLPSGTSFIPGVIALIFAIPGVLAFQTLTKK